MRRVVLGVCLIGMLALSLAAGATQPRDAIAGYWRTEGGEAIIHIQARKNRFPGTIAWLAETHYPADDPKGMGGQAVVDRHNPDPGKRDRSLIGLQMIKNLHYHVDDNHQAHWEDGRIYDSERGKWYDCTLWLADHDHLKVHGYIGVTLLGRTTTWVRVDDPATHPSGHPLDSGGHQEPDS